MFLIGPFYPNLFLDAALILFPLLYAKYSEKLKIRAIDFGLPAKGTWAAKDLLLALKITGALLLVSFALTIILTLANLNDLAGVEGAIRTLTSAPFPVLVYFMVVRVFAEEFFFRAFLVPRIGVVGSSALFAFSHFGYGSVAEIIGAFALGAVLAYYYSKEKRLVPNYIAHMIYNALAIGLMVSA